jgi:hypothetical protein
MNISKAVSLGVLTVLLFYTSAFAQHNSPPQFTNCPTTPYFRGHCGALNMVLQAEDFEHDPIHFAIGAISGSGIAPSQMPDLMRCLWSMNRP